MIRPAYAAGSEASSRPPALPDVERDGMKPGHRSGHPRESAAYFATKATSSLLAIRARGLK
jgi:hypothetical protein